MFRYRPARPLNGVALAGYGMSWSDWQPLDACSDHYGAALYERRLCTAAGPIAVPRFLATDAHGLIMIGQTNNMEARRKQFIRAVTKCQGHSEGNLLYYLLEYSPIRKLYPEHAIQYRFREEADKAAALLAENRVIKAYIREFGEAPPLNCAIPDRYGDWECGDAS